VRGFGPCPPELLGQPAPVPPPATPAPPQQKGAPQTGTARAEPRAFPSTAIEDCYGGMQLRDWFAGQALGGILSNVRADVGTDLVAATAYHLADAMMAERAKGGAA